MNIQWYPGHMTKTRRQMLSYMKQIDLVCEVVDARIPMASRNPDIDTLAGDKPRVMILNRIDLADPVATAQWKAYFEQKGMLVLETNGKTGEGTQALYKVVCKALKAQVDAWSAKGQTGHSMRLMIVGIPNVGKSTLINRFLGRKTAKAADKPGVTRGSQWFRLQGGLDLLDTPGILWPKFEDVQVGILLACTGAIKDDILDVETLACHLLELLANRSFDCLGLRYGITLPTVDETEGSLLLGYALLEAIGKKRGFVVSGGAIDTERAARIVLDEFRSGKLGRITLEIPPEGA